MEQIQNSIISVRAKAAGAELTSIIKNGIEYLWQADTNVWGRHAPILFPIVGKLNNNTYRIGADSFHLTQHGFARDANFTLVEESAAMLHYQLRYDDATLLKYPYKFELNVRYTISSDVLKVAYEVINLDNGPIVFAIGGHPAFNCPLLPNEQFEDYQLVFEVEEPIVSRLVDLTTGTIQDKRVIIDTVKNAIPITTALFDNDALVLNQLKSKWVGILHRHTGTGVKMSIDQFPLLGIWAKANTKKFVCLEPWQGLADHTNFEGQFADKEAIVVLNASDSWKAAYEIQII